jgi:hypothetical protein
MKAWQGADFARCDVRKGHFALQYLWDVRGVFRPWAAIFHGCMTNYYAASSFVRAKKEGRSAGWKRFALVQARECPGWIRV